MHSSPGWAGNPALPEKALAGSAAHSYVVPLSFEPNQGQVDEQVKYLARGQGYSLFLTAGAAVLGLRGAGPGAPTQWVSLHLRGAAASAIAGEELQAGRSNYFIGNNPAGWRTNIPNFSRVRYSQVYPGVDLIYYGRQGRLENDFEVSPGTNPKVIAWQLEGADQVRVNSAGDLVFTVGGKEVSFLQPTAYQMEGGQQRDIPIRYRVQGRKISFALGKYNRHENLVIDPVLTYSSYLGGTGGEVAYSVVVDGSGDAYVTGVTASTNFPTSPSVYQPKYAGDGDVFVTEFDPAGTGLIFSTYLGGTGDDTPAQIYLDNTRPNATGNLFLTGSTTSLNYPVTGAAFQQVFGGIQDAFLSELKPDGSALVMSTYIGGTGTDFGTALTLDSSGNIYVVGSANSTNFPTKNALQLGNNGFYDVFVTEVSPVGQLEYSTYLGGTLSDYGTGISVDSNGNILVSGYTFSSDFPTQNALQSTLAGGSDLFVSKFTPGSTSLLFSTYLGGSSNDESLGMTLDSGGNIYLTGSTQSLNFPVTTSAYQSSLLGTANAFITKLAPDASQVLLSTYFGGGQTDQADALALDSAGNIYITGYTQSTNFPLLDASQNVLGISGAGNCGSTNLQYVLPNIVCPDAFVVRFSAQGVPIYSTFLGGNGTDAGQGIAVDSSGAAYVVGSTTSPNFPATAGTYQWLYLDTNALSTAFVTKISPQDAPSVALSPQQINFGTQPLNSPTDPVTVTLTNAGSAPLSISSITASGDFTQTNTCGTFVPGGSGTCTIQVVFDPTSVGPETDEISITDNAGGTQGITVLGNGVLSGGSLIFSPTSLTFAAQEVGTTSTSQTALLINNGNEAVTLTNITATDGYAQTNNCGYNFPTVATTLNVGQACQVTVSFTPTASGTTTGSLVITSNAVKPTTSLTLNGTGTAVFSLSSNARSSIVNIGSTSATFTISALGPNTLRENSIVLKCSSGVTCNFNPSSISAGGSSQVTVAGLSATSANPTNFTVTGTSNGQSASVSLTIFFADFSLAATPSGTTVTAGNNATYTITVTPINGFNQPVLLSCPAVTSPGWPSLAVCYWNPGAVQPSGTGTSLTSTLTITTYTQSSTSRLAPPPPRFPPGPTRWLLVLALLMILAVMIAGRNGSQRWLRPQLRLAALLVAILLATLAVGCDEYVNPININPVVNGTPSGTYTITLTGSYATGAPASSTVTRTTTVTLSVLPTT